MVYILSVSNRNANLFQEWARRWRICWQRTNSSLRPSKISREEERVCAGMYGFLMQIVTFYLPPFLYLSLQKCSQHREK